MPAPGTVWAANSWDVDAWAANTWADASEATDISVVASSGSLFMSRARRRRERRGPSFLTALAVILAGCCGHPWTERRVVA